MQRSSPTDFSLIHTYHPAVNQCNYTKNSIEKAQKNRQKITFSEIKWDKYGGRIVAKVMINETDLGQELVRGGLARVYNGEKKKSWCN